jgi:hypothetical protein
MLARHFHRKDKWVSPVVGVCETNPFMEEGGE